ncbi:hypothetical protein AHAS_Ahas18G0049600 [Arachis hypogaea]
MISTSIERNQGLMMQMFPTPPPPPGSEDLVSQQSMEIVNNSSVASSSSSTASSSHSSSLLFNLSVLKDKLNQVQTLVGVILSPDQNLQDSTTSMAVSSMNSTIQEIIVTATSMMFTCQQIALAFPPPPPPPPPPGTIATTVAFANNHHELHQQHQRLLINNNNNNIRGHGHGFFSSTTDSEALDNWLGESYNNTGVDCKVNNNNDDDDPSVEISDTKEGAKKLDIIELDAEDLLAKYTHYCSVCGKGFKRDANLRMHMRAHGDEYKTSAALSNPLKQNNNENGDCLPKKYSCPQEGCRWNQKHAKFQPLKSMICAKNHYKRSHCPKMYVCKRCNQKQFSVLSDLRTHEKHCGDLKWQCSCGTTFSRKDKLMGHVALFVGHRALSIAFHQYNSKSRITLSYAKV